MDLLQLGSAFLTAHKPTQSIKIRYPGRPEFRCSATLIDTKTYTADQVKIQIQHIGFLVTKSLLPFEATRGMEVIWNNAIYEVVFDGKVMWSYNDQFQNEILLKTVYKHACG